MGLVYIYLYLEKRSSTVFYIMHAKNEMIHFCCQDIICKFHFWTLKSTFPEYMKVNRQLFYTFNEIMQQTFDKTKCGTTIFTNIEILRM